MRISLLALVFVLITFVGWSEGDAPQAICPTIFMSGNDVSCYGGVSDGNAYVTAIDGSGNYTYTWSNTVGGVNVTGPSNPGLSVGTYTVNVKDNVTGCTIIGSFVVGSPDPISTSASITDVDCFAQNTGAVDMTTIGGVAPYQFSWSNGATTEDLSGVGANNYTVNITDDNGCQYSKSYIVTQPIEALSGSGAVTDVACFGTATGSINVDVWGGTPSYAYTWDSGQPTQDVSNIVEGNYSVTVEDANGCTLTLPFYVGQPNILAGSGGSTAVLCYGEATGSVYYNPTGGTSPYDYSWQNSLSLFSENNSVLSNIPADDYQVTVTDANGCEYVDVINVAQPSALDISYTFSNVSCYGGNDGQIDVLVTGGIPTYSYEWTNSTNANVSTNEDITSGVAAIYDLTVTDYNGCEAYLQHEITQPNLPISFTYEVVDVLCFGENTGAVDLTVSGGTIPYTYSWTSGQVTEDINNVLSGTYGFTITDANGCIETSSAFIDQPLAPLQVTNTITDANCFGDSNGAIDLTVTGGTSPYTYTWDNSTFNLSYTQEDLIDFPADDYRYEVTDANGCTEVDTLTINQPDQLQVTYVQTDVLCYGESTGVVDITVTGGVLDYTYLWTNNNSTEDLINVPYGPYSVLVTDDHNCTVSEDFVITQPSDTMSFTFDVFDVHCNNGSNGEIDLFMAGGTPSYSYLWSNGETTSSIDNLTEGFYSFTTTDNNGCVFEDSIYVAQPDPFTTNEAIVPVSCYGGSDGVIDITPMGGTTPYSYFWLNSTFALSTQTEDLVDFVADTYQLEVTDSNGCVYEFFFDLPQPDSIFIDYEVTQVTCYGYSDGEVDVTVTGGNPGYLYDWSDGSTNEDLIGVVSDTFQLIVTDTKECKDTLTVFVPQPDSMIVYLDHDPVTCIDQSNGVAYVEVTGGNGGYMYDWSNGGVDDVNGGLSSETYLLTVTDILGCYVDTSIFITKIDAPCIDPPNAFTPNNDMYNDTWRIDNLDLYPNMHLQIFNKWGTLVNEQVGTYEEWDGKINGVDAPSSTYYWVIHLNYLDRSSVSGYVTIVR